MKSVEQQGMQAIQRSRELLLHQRVALSNHIRGLLMEVDSVIPQGFAALYQQLPEILGDGENELPDLYRPTLNLLSMQWQVQGGGGIGQQECPDGLGHADPAYRIPALSTGCVKRSWEGVQRETLFR